MLDRYVLTNFLLPFCYCFFGFLSIWLVFDLTDNGQDFIQFHVPLWKIIAFYATQFPQIIVISLPIGLLLALLYCLSRMSRTNEIISMLTAGRSLVRIVIPLFAAALGITALSVGMNYKLAPHSDALKKRMLYTFTHTKAEQEEMDTILFKNRTDDRAWYVQKINVKRNHLEGVEIIQQNKAGDIIQKYYAKSADYDPDGNSWTFHEGKTVNFDNAGNVKNEEAWLTGPAAQLKISHWSETPWRISSSEARPAGPLGAGASGIPLLQLRLPTGLAGSLPDASALPLVAAVAVPGGRAGRCALERRVFPSRGPGRSDWFDRPLLRADLLLQHGSRTGQGQPHRAFLGGVGAGHSVRRHRPFPALHPQLQHRVAQALHPLQGREEVMAQEWQITSRSHTCSITGKEFQDGEYFYTLLIRNKEGFDRQDLSEEAWKDRNENIQPYSFWRTKYETPPPPAPEALSKGSAEDLLRRYMAEEGAQHTNARYILALMLERKRLLKQVETRQEGDSRTLIYEHVRTGEVFVIPDPDLRLDQLAEVQMEVASQLA
ncbi:MAG: LptF/LptG family permease [Chthoniobacteraceae bacterium]